MRKLVSTILFLFVAQIAISQTADRQKQRGGKGKRADKQNQTRGVKMPTPAFRTDVPKRDYDIVLGRPTTSAVTVSLAAYETGEYVIEHGGDSGKLTAKIEVGKLTAGATKEIVIDGARSNARHYYRVLHRKPSESTFTASPEYSFQTQRKPGAEFVFTVQADSHLDFGIVPEKYKRTLANALADKTDFHIELGDTFMVDKYTDYRLAGKQYIAQRYYFSRLCHSAPLFFVLGNHDGEFGYRDTGGTDNMAVWSGAMRKTYFPNPFPNEFYTGNDIKHRSLGHLENYYAWHWGDALFVALDPFWSTVNKRGGQWNKTLGESQYNWLKQTLETSDAKHKFIFLHYLVGGLNNETRGAKSIAKLYEWGGHNTDGVNEWTQQRPGWAMPIHDLLVENQVSAVFHGHDHLYVREELDGIIYQEVPQPGHRRFGNTRSAAEYGYTDGVVLSSSGHVRVTVSAAEAKVEYIYSFLPNEERGDFKNGQVAHSYTIPAKR